MKMVNCTQAFGIALIIMSASLIGCGVKRVGNTDVLFTKADERVIYAHRQHSQPGSDSKQSKTIFCAEPSPDLAKAVEKSFGLSTQLEGTHPSQISARLAGSVASARAEAIAQLGERLATIQLLRDGLYRACEAYANGVLSKAAYAVLLSRYDDTMVTLLFGELAAGNFGRSLVSLTGSGGSTVQKDDYTGGAMGKLLNATDMLEEKNAILKGLKEEQNALEQVGKTDEAKELNEEIGKVQTAMEKDRVTIQEAAKTLEPIAELTEAGKKVAEATEVADQKKKELTAAKEAGSQDQIAVKVAEVDTANKEVEKKSNNLKQKATAIATASASGGSALNRQPTGEIADKLGLMQRSYLFDVNSDAIAVACIVAMGEESNANASLLSNWCVGSQEQEGVMSRMIEVNNRVLMHKVGLRANGTSYTDEVIKYIFKNPEKFPEVRNLKLTDMGGKHIDAETASRLLK